MSIVTQIENANALGRQNLADKGVATDGTETTYKIMSMIADVSGGGAASVEYSSIIHNDDNTITLTETNGTEHTMACEYDGDKLISVTYDGETVELTYDGDVLVAIGGMSVDMSNAPATSGGLDYTVIFTSEGEPYEIVSVKDGNSINAPETIPIGKSGVLMGWQINGETIMFPYTPTSDTEINAKFSTVRSEIEWYGTGNWLRDEKGVVAKDNEGVVVVGRCENSGATGATFFFDMLVSRVEEYVIVIGATNNVSYGNIVYNNDTYYYAISNRNTNYVKPLVEQCAILPNAQATKEDAIKSLLDYYFMVELGG